MYREHLGLEEIDHSVNDPAKCYKVRFEFGRNEGQFSFQTFQDTAESNTKVYDNVFGRLIELRDTVTSFEKLDEQKVLYSIACCHYYTV